MSIIPKKRKFGCQFRSCGGAGLLVVWVLSSVCASAADPATVVPGMRRRIVARADVEGKLLFNADGSGVRRRSLRLSGRLEYLETVLRVDDGHLAQTLRDVEHSTASLVVGKWTSSPEFSQRGVPLVARWGGAAVQIYSARSPLSSRDLDVVALQVDPLALDRLIPVGRRTKLAQSNPEGTWTVAEGVGAALLGWEVCSHQTLKCKVVRRDTERGVVLIEISGDLLGAVDGSTSEAKLRGKLNYDPRLGQCVWADVLIEEKRAIGHVAPGFEVKARIRVQAVPQDPIEDDQLRSHLAAIPSAPQATDLYLAFASRFQGFEIMHDRSWKLMVDGPSRTIFRLIHDGDLIAQANFSRIRSTERPTLQQFQQEVKRALGDSFERFVAASEDDRSDGTRVYRVIVVGAVESLPIQWMYCHFRNGHGAVTAVISIDARLVEKHAGFDERVLASLRVTPLPTPQQAKADEDTSRATR